MNAAASLGLLLLGVILLFDRVYRDRARRRSRPPGPKGLPLIGNVLDIPLENAAEKYALMGKEHGDMVYLEALGQSILVLNSFRRAHDLLDKRSSNNSSRPWSVLLNDLMNCNWQIGFLPYGEALKRRRRLLQNYLHRNMLGQYRPIVQQATRTLLQGLLQDPADYWDHVRTHAGAIILKTMYGYDVQPRNDPFVRLTDVGNDIIIKTVQNGVYLVDVFPILHEVSLANDVHAPCLITHYMGKLESAEVSITEEAEIIKDATGTAYSAGADTTASTLITFILAMVLHPEIQKKAQEELDSIVGHVPSSIEQIYHDIYDGYNIPANTVIFAKRQAMLHDGEVYPDPEIFNPDRYTSREGKEAQQDPSAIAFGFGRRVCPGKYLAEESVWLAIACVLSTFTIEKALDEEEHEIVPPLAFSSGLISSPEPFKCRFTARSAKVKEIIQSYC